MSIERYSTATLMEMQTEAEAPSQFFTNLFFSTEVYFDTLTVEFDMVRKGRRMAPFVAPTVRGRPVKREGFMTFEMKPAYVKITTTVDMMRPLSRMPGEQWGGSLSPMERLNRLMTEDINLHSEMLTNRIEWMAAQTVLNGQYTVVGPEYPEKLVDFQWSPNLQVVLAGAATWDQATSNPLRDIEDMALEVRKESYGAICSDVILDRLAWQLLRDHPDVKELLDLNVGRDPSLSGTSFDRGIRNNQFGNGSGAELVARIAGRFNVWVYEAYYEDESGAQVAYMPDYTCIVASPAAAEGKQMYGAILDSGANYQSVKQYLKSRSQWDPTGEELLSQSAPLIAPKRINTWGRLTVA